MSQQVLVERFFERLISGDRTGAREIVDQCLSADAPAEAIIDKLFFPTYEMVQKLFRSDQLTVIGHHYATRLLRMLADQMQQRLVQQDRNGKSVLLLCGPKEGDELAGQFAADMLEAAGFDVRFAGGGIANDEVIAQIGELRPAALVLYGTAPSDLPHIRTLVDELRDMGVCPGTQIVVGGGVFNRAEGLAEEVGADIWAATPSELVAAMNTQSSTRMASDQRTVGRRRRSAKTVAA
jgi:methanogenic corrinoid protein MtbC1